MKPRFLLGIAFMTLTAVPALADPTWKLDANDSSYSYHCGGDDWVAINGNNNSITIEGDCSEIEVTGSHNKVSAESVATIRVTGNDNDVRYTSAPAGKARAAVKNRGKANTIRKRP
jgi:hypothetical protein